MNKISFNCQQCGKLIEKSIRNAGMQMRCPDCAAKITIPAQAPADELVNTSPEIQDTIPLAVPQAAPQGTLSATPSVTPSAIPVATPQAVPPVTPSVTPSAIPVATPQAVPSVTPSDTPSDTPQATPQVVPEVTAEANGQIQTDDFQQQPEKSSNPISKKAASDQSPASPFSSHSITFQFTR